MTKEEFKQIILDNKSKIYAKDYTFFAIEFLVNLFEKSLLYANECQICKQNIEELIFLANDYPKFINGNREQKKEFEDRVSKIEKHLINIHGYQKQDYYKPFYASICIAIMSIICIFLYFVFGISGKIIVILLCVSMFVGAIIGSIKDKKRKKQNKIF